MRQFLFIDLNSNLSKLHCFFLMAKVVLVVGHKQVNICNKFGVSQS